ncbi:MAG: hypothetical protein ACRD3N_00905 [Terracidiphilus sp.]
MWEKLRKFFKAFGAWLAPWVRYAYFLRFSILLWWFPLVLIGANSPSAARSLVSGMVTPTRWVQYLCAGFFLVAGSFVALILAHIVVINGKERFGDHPPVLLQRLFADSRGRYEWIAPVFSQLNNAIVFWYFFWNGQKEGVVFAQIAWGLAAGVALAAAFWYAMTAFYYLTYQPPASHDHASGAGAAAARTLLFPRSWLLLSANGEGHQNGDALEDAEMPPILRWFSRFFPVPGYRWPPLGDLYEGHYFSLLAACGFFALYWMLWPLTAPVPVRFWSLVSIVLYACMGAAVAIVVFLARPARAADARNLLFWKILITAATLGFAAAIALLYYGSDAERFPILALVLILVISLSWALGAIAFFADRFRIPVLTAIILVTILPRVLHMTGGHEEHYLSTALRPAEATLPTPSQILEDKLAGDPNQPLVVVTSTGGGIHAAAWTAAVLGHLENVFAADGSLKSFHAHVLLLSTVSGGSSGLYAYMREIDPETDGGHADWQRMEFAAQCSSLEAVGWGLVYYDIPKALVPFLPYFVPPSSGVDDLDRSPMDKDRTWTLRRAFARNLNDPYCGLQPANKRLMPLRKLTQAGQANVANRHALTLGNLNPLADSLPAFTMNTTTVEGGDRFLLANYAVPPYHDGPLVPPPAESFLQIYGGFRFPSGGQSLYTDLPLATGAQLSATFPYVSSAATFPNAAGARHMHFVDGGYYDNDGTGSAIEFLRSALDGLPADSKPVRIVLVEIRNSPAAGSAPGSSSSPWNLVDQLVAPLEAFYGAGHESVTARNRNDLVLLEGAYKGRLKMLAHIVIADECSVQNVHTDPLNWSLTPKQQEEVVNSADLPDNVKKYARVGSFFKTGGQLPSGIAAGAQVAEQSTPACTPAD